MIKPRYSTPALQDLVHIGDYIARDNPRAAVKLMDRLEMECQRIAEQPDRGMSHEELPESHLVFPVGNYLIVYQTNETGVFILRIVHGARDLSQLFPES
jgi:toxin ParE1/3/4